MSGAARLAAEGALRTGAGLVRVVTDPSSAVAVGCGRPELMVSAVALTDRDPAVRAAAFIELNKALAWATVLAIGPGLGLEGFGPLVFTHVMAWLGQVAALVGVLFCVTYVSNSHCHSTWRRRAFLTPTHLRCSPAATRRCAARVRACFS